MFQVPAWGRFSSVLRSVVTLMAFSSSLIAYSMVDAAIIIQELIAPSTRFPLPWIHGKRGEDPGGRPGLAFLSGGARRPGRCPRAGAAGGTGPAPGVLRRARPPRRGPRRQ